MPKSVKYFPEVDTLEHEDATPPETKRVLIYGWDFENLQKVRLSVNSLGQTVGGGYGTNDLETVGSITYIGRESADGAWLLMKLDETSGMNITWASIKNNATETSYTDAWTDRASLTYEDYSEAV